MKVIDNVSVQLKARAGMGGVVPINLTYMLILMPSSETEYDSAHLIINDPSNSFSNLICAMNLYSEPSASPLINEMPDASNPM